MKTPRTKRFKSGRDVFDRYIPDYRPPILVADDFQYEPSGAPEVAERLLDRFRESLQLKKGPSAK